MRIFRKFDFAKKLRYNLKFLKIFTRSTNEIVPAPFSLFCEFGFKLKSNRSFVALKLELAASVSAPSAIVSNSYLPSAFNNACFSSVWLSKRSWALNYSV